MLEVCCAACRWAKVVRNCKALNKVKLIATKTTDRYIIRPDGFRQVRQAFNRAGGDMLGDHRFKGGKEFVQAGKLTPSRLVPK